MTYTSSRGFLIAKSFYNQMPMFGNNLEFINLNRKNFNNLIKFIDGLFDLDIWNKILFWPFNFTNATSFNTVYSLGGLLGSLNPTASLLSNNGYALLNNQSVYVSEFGQLFVNMSQIGPLPQGGIFVVSEWGENWEYTAGNLFANRQLFTEPIGQGAPGLAIGGLYDNQIRFMCGENGNQYAQINTPIRPTTPTNLALSFLYDGTYTRAALNGQIVPMKQQGTELPTDIPPILLPANRDFSLGGPFYADGYTGGAHFLSILNGPVNTQTMYNLYKSTLGSNLNLP